MRGGPLGRHAFFMSIGLVRMEGGLNVLGVAATSLVMSEIAGLGSYLFWGRGYYRALSLCCVFVLQF